MGILEYLNNAAKLPNVYYHKFIRSYKKESDDIYVFCEGDADLSYYCEQIERIAPDRMVHKFPVECKNNVIQIWNYIDWQDYQKKRVLFFVDRDLSYWVNEPQEYDSNVYVTDGYSFENDAVSPHMFIKILEDVYGYSRCSLEEKNKILKIYSEKWRRFVDGSYDLMGCILYKYESTHEHSARNLEMHFFLDTGEEDIWKNTIKGMPREDYVRKQLKMDDVDLDEKLKDYKNRFINEYTHYSIRGKWCLEFMILLLEYIYLNGRTFAPSLYEGNIKEPKKLFELTSRGAIAMIAPRMIPAKSLVLFLMSNIGGINA